MKLRIATLIALVVLGLYLGLTACASPGAPPADSPNVLEATPTPAIIVTVTSTVAPTPTSSPLPKSGSTPFGFWTPTPAPPTPTPPPAMPVIRVEPSRIGQGGLTVIKLVTPDSVKVEGVLSGGERLYFAKGEGYYFSIVGVEAWSPLGKRTATLKLRYPGGNETALAATFEVVPTGFPVEQIYLEPGTSELLAPAVVKKEKDVLDELVKPATPEKLWKQSFLVPTQGETSSPFGERRSYNGGPATSYHEGLDIAANTGSPVVAANSGRVVWVGPMDVRGNVIVINHGLGVYSGYYHLDQFLVQGGQDVERGQPIAKVGSTGLSTGPHLHWDMKVGGVNVDPLLWTEREIP